MSFSGVANAASALASIPTTGCSGDYSPISRRTYARGTLSLGALRLLRLVVYEAIATACVSDATKLLAGICRLTKSWLPGRLCSQVCRSIVEDPIKTNAGRTASTHKTAGRAADCRDGKWHPGILIFKSEACQAKDDFAYLSSCPLQSEPTPPISRGLLQTFFT